MSGFGVTLGAEFIAATGGDMGAFASGNRLAGVSGLAAVPRDSGRIRGNLKRPAATTGTCCALATCLPWSASAPIPPGARFHCVRQNRCWRASAVGAGNDRESDLAAIAHDLDRRRLPDRELTDRHNEFAGVGDRAVADADDQVIL
jgi:hypothetical protein